MADAHQYLLENFDKYDFIWSSPPCPSHSIMRLLAVYTKQNKPVYPDMRLYEEILFLQQYFKGKYCVENVRSWYQPLIRPQVLNRHYYWTNFIIKRKTDKHSELIWNSNNLDRMKLKKIDISQFKNIDKKKVLNNMVNGDDGLLILNCAINEPQKRLATLLQQ